MRLSGPSPSQYWSKKLHLNFKSLPLLMKYINMSIVYLFFKFLVIDFHYGGRALRANPGLLYPSLHSPLHTLDNNRWGVVIEGLV